MRRNPAILVVLLLVTVLISSACVPLRTLGPVVTHEARVPDILLGPYDGPERPAEQVMTTSDHLRDLQAAGALETAQKLPSRAAAQFISSSDYLRDLQAADELQQ